jgi:eukaryotic-like serine/threonine-protein kinase
VSTIPEPLAAALADRYRIERELGQGGMATVYLAQDLKHERPVAIKVLRPELAASLGPERFLREIHLTARLQHPNILPLLDSGSSVTRRLGDSAVDESPAEPPSRRAAEYLYYVMPYVAGESLRDRLTRDRQLPLEAALALTRDVADALGYAHGQGLIHRDIKPENILLAGGHAVVADFGIARAVEQAGGTRLTETGLAVGTPDYMSPEQGAGDPDLDGRTDLYSLGCVLYEMLAGHPPFLGRTPQEVRARHALDPVPPLRAARATVGAGVEAVLERALAKQPADRFATAAEFVAALETGVGAGGRLSAPVSAAWRRRAFPVTLVLLVIIGLTWRFSSRPAALLDPDLLAITPFEVHDTGLEVWREGLVDVLSRNLDGAGPLRTVPLSVILRRWQGHADRTTAAALGHQAGAGLVAFGDVASRGGDSVTLRLTMLDVARNTTTGDVEVSGPADRMTDLTDSLGRRLLGALGRTRPIAAVRQGSLGAASLPALKAFLRGEQWYRRGIWDSALVSYDQSLSQDSGFTLANYRMGLVMGWGSPTAGQYGDAETYGARAQRLNHGQAPRDSLVIAAGALDDSGDTAGEKGDFASFLAFHRRALATVQTAVRLYPGDPEVWYWLGENLFHFPPNFRGTAAEALAAFDHAIALDSGFAPAYEHAPILAMQTAGVDLTRRYLRAYVELNPTQTYYSSNLRFAASVFDTSRDSAFTRMIDSAPGRELFTSGQIAAWWPDSAETGIRLFRALQRARPERPIGHQLVAAQLAVRGHLKAAWRLYDDSVRTRFSGVGANPFPELALLGVVPADTAARVFGQVFEPAAKWPPDWQLIGLAWWSDRGDTASLSRFMAGADQAGPRAATVKDSLLIRYLGTAAAAYRKLARRDTAAALAAFEAMPDSLCALQTPAPSTCLFQKFTQARLEAARREDRKAAATIDRWVADNWDRGLPTPVIVLARLERAHLAERLGQRELAARHYQFVSAMWRDADPGLQPFVTEAREGLQRLTAEPR